MKSKQRLLALLALLLLIIGMKVGQQVYRWVAYSDERAEIERLQEQLTDAGLEIVRTVQAVDSLQRAVTGMDEGLGAARVGLERDESRIARGDRSVERAYRGELSAYNDRVGARNELHGEWSEMVKRNRVAVDRFNLFADSIRALAERMGEPYYPIPSPAEIANRDSLFDESVGSLR